MRAPRALHFIAATALPNFMLVSMILACEKAVKKPGVKCIARAGRVAATARSFKARRFDKTSFVIHHSARGPDRHTNQRTTIPALQLDEGFALIAEFQSRDAETLSIRS